MGLKYTDFFEDELYEVPDVKIITCKGCSSHLCMSSMVVSDNFTGASGAAYLVDRVINVELNPVVQESEMTTGHYLISKAHCHQCKVQLGWKYHKAFLFQEKYKEGKFVIERAYLSFIPNNSSTTRLMEQVLKNKLKRRYSSTSSVSADDESVKTPSACSSRSNSSSSADDRKSFIRNLEKGSRRNQHTLPHHSFLSAHPHPYPQLDYRDVTSGVFLNRIRVPGLDKDSAVSATTLRGLEED